MLILASASPRRQEMLAQLGVAFRVENAAVDERRMGRETPQAMTVRLALHKAQTVFARFFSDDGAAGGGAVLAGDTVVAIDREILGKPVDRAHALAMLRRLSGNTHTVFSAVALVTRAQQSHRLSTTEVVFDHLSEGQLTRYCDSAEPFDKAGAYGIQGAGGAFVKSCNGSFSGAMGLPLWETQQLLRALENAGEGAS